MAFFFSLLLLPFVVLSAELAPASDTAGLSGLYEPFVQSDITKSLEAVATLFKESYTSMKRLPAVVGSCPADIELEAEPRKKKDLEATIGRRKWKNCNLTEGASLVFKQDGDTYNAPLLSPRLLNCTTTEPLTTYIFERIKLTTLKSLLEDRFVAILTKLNVDSSMVDAILGRSGSVSDSDPYWLTSTVYHSVAEARALVSKLDEFWVMELDSKISHSPDTESMSGGYHTDSWGMFGSQCFLLRGGAASFNDSIDIIASLTPYFASLFYHAKMKPGVEEPSGELYPASNCELGVDKMTLGKRMDDNKTATVSIFADGKNCTTNVTFESMLEAESMHDPEEDDPRAHLMTGNYIANVVLKTLLRDPSSLSQLSQNFGAVLNITLKTLVKVKTETARFDNCSLFPEPRNASINLLRAPSIMFSPDFSLPLAANFTVDNETDITAFLVRNGDKCMFTSNKTASESMMVDQTNEPLLNVERALSEDVVTDASFAVSADDLISVI